MKPIETRAALLLTIALASPCPLRAQWPVGTAFTYQGQLADADGPVCDSANLRFTLWNHGTAGTQIGSTLEWTLFSTDLDNGLFSVPLDGGPSVELSDTIVENGNVTHFAISPDGATVVYRADQETDETFELYRVPIAGGTPLLRSAGQEERTTARDQLTDLTTRPRLGSGHKGSTGGTPSVPLAPPPRPPAPGLRQVAILRRLDQAAAAGMLPPGVVATLQADWEEE